MMRASRTHKALERAVRLAETPMPEDTRQRVRAATMASVRSALPPAAVRPGIRLVRMVALAALAVALFGGTAYAVMRSAPGDTLYPIREAASKIGVGQVPLEPQIEEPIERKLAPVAPSATDADESEYRGDETDYERDSVEPKKPADEVEPAEERESEAPRGRRDQESEDSDSGAEGNGRRSGSGQGVYEEHLERPRQENDSDYEDDSADSY